MAEDRRGLLPALALPLAEVMRVPQHYACRIWLPGQEC